VTALQALLDGRTSEQANQLRTISDTLYRHDETIRRETTGREQSEAAFRQILSALQATMDARLAEHATQIGGITEALRRGSEALHHEATGRQQSETAHHQTLAALHQQVGEHTAQLRTMAAALDQEIKERKAMEAVRDETRVPINSLVSMTELALDTELTDTQREYLKSVKSSADAVLTALDTDTSPPQAPAAPRGVEATVFSLRETVGDTIKPLAVRARQKGLDLICQIAPEVLDGVLGDPGPLRQLLVNVVGNAIKFTEQGEVTVRVEQAAQTADYTVLLVTVADTGIGIPADRQKLIFDVLARQNGPAQSRRVTASLGLPVASQLVRKMGGRIWFESTLYEGSTFRFTARLGLPEGSAARPISAARIRPTDRFTARQQTAEGQRCTPLHILLAEDSPYDRASAVRVLEALGHTVVAVEDGQRVLAALEADSFDIILMDLRMPRIDAFEAAAAIRTGETGTGARTPIVALASPAATGDLERYLAVGIDAYVAKPLDAAELVPTIERLLGMAEQQDPSPTPDGST
jgi:signal transduction histidine kinase/ActR/RegA family two-component response regulator